MASDRGAAGPPSADTVEPGRRRRLLTILVVVQLVFFTVIFGEFLSYYLIGYDRIPWEVVEIFETSEVLLSALGIFSGIAMIVLLNRRTRQVEDRLKAASGAMEDLMEQRFREWNLTTSETEIARFTIKGMSIPEIADIRGTSVGTIKAQNNAIYRKAGVNSRSQLLGLFVEELVEGKPLVPDDAGREAGRRRETA